MQTKNHLNYHSSSDIDSIYITAVPKQEKPKTGKVKAFGQILLDETNNLLNKKAKKRIMELREKKCLRIPRKADAKKVESLEERDKRYPPWLADVKDYSAWTNCINHEPQTIEREQMPEPNLITDSVIHLINKKLSINMEKA